MPSAEWSGPTTMGHGKRTTGDVGVLLSGGLDSVTLLYEAEYEKRLRGAWFVDYGQGGVRQEGAIAAKLGCEWNLVGHHLVVPIPGHTAMLHQPGAEGLRIVPARNAILLSIVAAHTESYSMRELWYGATADDRDYPDCSQTFIDAMNKVLSYSVRVRVRAPWIERGWGKREVVQRARELGVKIGQTWSCYTPNDYGKPCQTCSACRRRAEALSTVERGTVGTVT